MSPSVEALVSSLHGGYTQDRNAERPALRQGPRPSVPPSRVTRPDDAAAAAMGTPRGPTRRSPDISSGREQGDCLGTNFRRAPPRSPASLWVAGRRGSS